jgi:hypothetical protein
VVLDCLIDLLLLILSKLLHSTLDDRIRLSVGLRIGLEALACRPFSPITPRALASAVPPAVFSAPG